MQPVIISATIQEFDGRRYYLCGKYFQHKGSRLHLAVWKHHHGPVPSGYHVHHIDNDRSHNHLENLECLSIREHLGGRHGKQAAENGRKGLPKALKAAAVWHGSEAGRKWHSENFDRHVRHVVAQRITVTCQQCAKPYAASRIKRDYSKFCGGACKQRALRRRRAVFKLDELQ
jgi:hypothetical protein